MARKYRDSVYFMKQLTGAGSGLPAGGQNAGQAKKRSKFELAPYTENIHNDFRDTLGHLADRMPRKLFFFVKCHGFTGRLQEFVFFLAAHDHIVEFTETGTGRDRVTSDHILFQAEHFIRFTVDCGR